MSVATDTSEQENISNNETSKENRLTSNEEIFVVCTSEESCDSSLDFSCKPYLNQVRNRTPIEKPKRRWLREVEFDLARGLISLDSNNINQNSNRPTVLVHARTADNNNVPNIQVQEMQGALALMELANSSNGFYTQL